MVNFSTETRWNYFLGKSVSSLFLEYQNQSLAPPSFENIKIRNLLNFLTAMTLRVKTSDKFVNVSLNEIHYYHFVFWFYCKYFDRKKMCWCHFMSTFKHCRKATFVNSLNPSSSATNLFFMFTIENFIRHGKIICLPSSTSDSCLSAIDSR